MDTQNTADILSKNSRHFWLYWKLDNAHVEQLQLGTLTDDQAIIKWPVPVTFSPTQISVQKAPESHVEIRYECFSFQSFSEHLPLKSYVNERPTSVYSNNNTTQ